MDTPTHGLLGSVTARLFRYRSTAPITWAAGVGAMAPDLDLFIRSSTNPFIAIEYHRQFTHSLIFIPFGGFLVGLLLWLLQRRKHPLKLIIFASTLGFSTHCFLDACTSYGTQLFWPFSNARVAWDIIPIVDPIFSLLILVVGLIFSLRRKSPIPARIAMVFALLFLGLGTLQHERGLQLQRALAAQRGHSIEHGRVIPTFANLLVWRSSYKSDGKIYVDAFRLGLDGKTLHWEGGSQQAFAMDSFLEKLPPHSVLADDLRLYRWFSDDFLGVFGNNPLTLGDMRYSFGPQEVSPVWGIRFNPEAIDKHPGKARFPVEKMKALEKLWKMILGKVDTEKKQAYPCCLTPAYSMRMRERIKGYPPPEAAHQTPSLFGHTYCWPWLIFHRSPRSGPGTP